jgi:hypothetical protein
LYCYKNINKISGAFLWNMPRIVLDPSKKPLSHKMIFGMKVIWTMLTNLPTYDRHPINSTEKLSSNKILIKMNKIVAPTKSSTKIIISVWLSMRPSWKKLIKILKNNPKNFFIFQSKDDFFFDEKNWKKCSKLFPNNLFFLNEGMHILSFEEPQNLMLFEKIDNLLSDISHEK